MILFGRGVIALWAAAFAYVGFLLCMGQGGVVMTALEAGRISEAIMNGVFVLLVAIGTIITVVLFWFVGVLNEGAR